MCIESTSLGDDGRLGHLRHRVLSRALSVHLLDAILGLRGQVQEVRLLLLAMGWCVCVCVFEAVAVLSISRNAAP